MPFIGLAEAYALAAFRSAGVPMQRIRPAIDVLDVELGLEHALASRRLYTDGAEVLFDYATHAGDTPEGDSARELVVVRNNQRVFSEVVQAYLQRVDFAADGYAQLIRLPQYRAAEVTTRDCPECLSTIPIAASRCMYCTSQVAPVTQVAGAAQTPPINQGNGFN